MKLKYIKMLFAAGILTAATTSCDIERIPEETLETRFGFETVTHASYWDNYIYVQLRGRNSNIHQFSTDVQADQLNATLEYGNRNGNPHRWSTFNDDDYTIRDVWASYYSAIYNLNLMIIKFEDIVPANDAEKDKLDNYKGDAHLARAFYYHNLVTRYAKMYDPATAAADLGVPLVLEASETDFSALPARSTVKQVYDQILLDIAEAKTKLAKVNGLAGSNKFTIDAVTALEARVKLYMQDYAGAKLAAESLISGAKYKLYATADGVKNMWHTDQPAEDILLTAVNKPDELPPVNSIYLGFQAANGRFMPDFIPTQWVIDSYPTGDFRKAAYFRGGTMQLGGVLHTNGQMVNKYPGNPAYFTTSATNYAHRQKIFRIAEMYMIAAEGALKSSTPNEAAALSHINAIRVARGLSALTGVSGNALWEEFKAERTRELAFEGFRLDDLRRWKLGFQRHDSQNPAFIQKGADFDQKKVDANDPKFTWGIPSRDRTINPNIIQNTGW